MTFFRASRSTLRFRSGTTEAMRVLFIEDDLD